MNLMLCLTLSLIAKVSIAVLLGTTNGVHMDRCCISAESQQHIKALLLSYACSCNSLEFHILLELLEVRDPVSP